MDHCPRDAAARGATHAGIISSRRQGLAAPAPRHGARHSAGLALPKPPGSGKREGADLRATKRLSSDGTLGEAEEVVRLPRTVPDGVALDVAGNLYVACYRPDRLYRLSVNGRLDTLAEDPAGTVLNAPTNVTFAGPALDRLVVANLGGWHLAVCAMDVAGQPLTYPEPIGV